jgi:hypothetical protein
MVKDPLTGGASSLLLQHVRCPSLSIFLFAFTFLFAFISASLPGEPRHHSGELPNIPCPYQSVETRPRLAPGSYCNRSRMRFWNLSPPWREGGGSTKNTVAVVLNWSRFQNVRRIVSLLCGSELDSIIKHVLVWNNNPNPVTYLVRGA